MTKSPLFQFKAVELEQRSLVHQWLTLPHVAPWFYGQGLENTFRHLDEFLKGESSSHYWLAYDGDLPFAFLITSTVETVDELRRWCTPESEAITLDMLIGEDSHLGRGLATPLIQQFLLAQFPDIQEVLIDPEATNLRAIHVYEKAGFSRLGEFIPNHSPHPHYMMRLDMSKLEIGRSGAKSDSRQVAAISSSDYEELKKLEESLWRVETRFNREFMNSLLLPEFIEFGRSGRIYSREETLLITPQPIEILFPLKNFSMALIDSHVALVTYVSEVQYKELELANRSSIWVKREGGWQLRFHQGTPVGKSSASFTRSHKA